MSLYADYLKEKTSDEIIENELGFASYRFLNETQVYIVDLFVKKEARKDHIASAMANQIADLAKQKGCTEMLGTVVPSAKNSTDSIRVLLAYGMKLKSAANDLIVFYKEL